MLLLSSAAGAQDLLRSIPANEVLHPSEIVDLGDLDGDGASDLAIGIRAIQGAKRIEVHSGGSGTLLYVVGGAPGPQFYGHLICPLEDRNADGAADFAVIGTRSGDANSPPGVLDVRSGSDGSLLDRFDPPAGRSFGEFPAPIALGDVDGDGRRDVLIATQGGPLSLQAYSTATGLPLYMVVDDPNRAVGPSVCRVDDMDGDLIADFAVSAFDVSAATTVLEIRSGATGATLLSHFVPLGLDLSPIASVSDLDGDGLRDVASASVFERSVRLISSATGAVLRVLTSSSANVAFGAPLVEIGDVDFDGAPDLLVQGAGSTIPGSAFVEAFSLVDGHPIFLLEAPNGQCCLGARIAVLPGADDEGFASFAALQSGTVFAPTHLFRYAPFVGTSYCTASANSTGSPAAIEGRGTTSLASDLLVLAAEPLPASQFGLFFYGPAQVQVPFGNGFRCVAPGATGLGRLPVEKSDASGRIFHRLDYDSPPTQSTQILAGSTWHFQAWFRDPLAGGAGFNTSDALTLSFAP